MRPRLNPFLQTCSVTSLGAAVFLAVIPVHASSVASMALASAASAPAALLPCASDGRVVVGERDGAMCFEYGTVESDLQGPFGGDGSLLSVCVVGEGHGPWKPADVGLLLVTGEVAVFSGVLARFGGGTAYDVEGNVLGSMRLVTTAVRTAGRQEQ